MKVRYAILIVNNMEESVDLYKDFGFRNWRRIWFTSGKITLLKCEGDAGIELIENASLKPGCTQLVWM